MQRRHYQKLGFTLVELLVVLAIIALLIAILIPALSAVRERANRIKCMSNLRGIGQAMRLYAYDNKNQYPRVLYADGSGPRFFATDWEPDAFLAQSMWNDVTAGMFLLARNRTLKLETFVCPSSNQQVDRALSATGFEIPPTQRSNFRFTQPQSGTLSYAFANQYPPVAFPYQDHLIYEFKHSPTAPAQNAIAADRNDGIDRYRTTNPDAPREDIKTMNSRNHRSEGQNVLFNDGSVQWCKTPFVGYARDHIYTTVDNNPQGWAQGRYDSMLLPRLPVP